MKAMVLERICDLADNPAPLTATVLPVPQPAENELLLHVAVCGVCHTELDEIEGRTPPPHFPVVPGHQVVGHVAAVGRRVTGFSNGERVGVGWIYSACGRCTFCRGGNENLCAEFRATGRDVNGGYAEYMTVPAAFAVKIPPDFSDAQAAPLLCAGAIGYRSLKLTGIRDGQRLGLTGFGASAHLVLQMARHLYPGSEVFVFARSEHEQAFARELGAAWAGDTAATAPHRLAAVIDTTPAWRPIVEALRQLLPGGRLVINAIRKESFDRDALLAISYPTHLWQEKEIKSVANITRADISEFLALAAGMQIRPEVQLFPLEDANRALLELKQRRIRGAKVLSVAERL